MNPNGVGATHFTKSKKNERGDWVCEVWLPSPRSHSVIWCTVWDENLEYIIPARYTM